MQTSALMLSIIALVALVAFKAYFDKHWVEASSYFYFHTHSKLQKHVWS